MRDTIPLPSSERAPAADVQAQARVLAEVPALQSVLDAIPGLVMLVNAQRQVVMASRRLVEFADAESSGELLGLRFGEVLECVNSVETGNGCGTTPSCTVCGAFRGILDTRFGRAQSHTCSIVRRGLPGEPLDLDVSATPIEIAGLRLILVCALDNADRVHRERLECGILPQALALLVEMEALAGFASDNSAGPDVCRQALRLVGAASKRLSELVRGHTDLAAAEAGRLPVMRAPVSARDLLSQAVGEIAAPGIAVVSPTEDALVDTDPDLARRVLRELLLNAIEAAPSGAAAGFRVSEAHVDFYVHNPGEMPYPVRLQVFARAYSTKAPGRGYGAYFAKLVTERCLDGSVSFQSSAEGSTFNVRLPRARGVQEVTQ